VPAWWNTPCSTFRTSADAHHTLALVHVDGQMVPSTWRWRMECSYCDYVVDVSLPHGLKTRSMAASFGDSVLNHMKRHWVLSDFEAAALNREWSEPAS